MSEIPDSEKTRSIQGSRRTWLKNAEYLFGLKAFPLIKLRIQAWITPRMHLKTTLFGEMAVAIYQIIDSLEWIRRWKGDLSVTVQWRISPAELCEAHGSRVHLVLSFFFTTPL